MDVGNSVRKSIDDRTAGDLDGSTLHACNAIDAKKVYQRAQQQQRFTGILRGNGRVTADRPSRSGVCPRVWPP